jgi:cytochrome c oxidase assembly factor CtaG
MDPTATAVLASWSLDLGTLCLLLAIAALYFRGWLKLHAESHKYTIGRLACFAGGLSAIG